MFEKWATGADCSDFLILHEEMCLVSAAAERSEDLSAFPWLTAAPGTEEHTKAAQKLKRYEVIMNNANTWHCIASNIKAVLCDDTDYKTEAEAAEKIAKDTAAAKNFEGLAINLATVSLASLMLVFPRKPNFQEELQAAHKWVTRSPPKGLHLSLQKLPKKIQQLYAEAGPPTGPTQLAPASSKSGMLSEVVAPSACDQGGAIEPPTKKAKFANVLKKMKAK